MCASSEIFAVEERRVGEAAAGRGMHGRGGGGEGYCRGRQTDRSVEVGRKVGDGIRYGEVGVGV